MHKKGDLLAGAGDVAKIGIETRFRQHIGFGDDKILARVRLTFGPFDISAFMAGRNGNVEARIIQLSRPPSAKALFGLVVFLPRARHIGCHDFRIGGLGVYGLQHIRPRSARAG